jgi:hypothetical protein
MNPYQFAYQNPNLYSDPTGLFSISEINASQVIKNELERQTYQTIKSQIQEKAQGVVGNIFQSTLKTILGGSEIGGVLNSALFDDRTTLSSTGFSFERVLSNALCSVMLGSYSQYVKDLWVTPSVSTEGRPTGDGFNCGGFTRTRTGRISVAGLDSNPKPDFIIKNGGPASTDPVIYGGNGYEKAFIIGDVKLTPSAAKDDAQGNVNQWQAMVRYANFYAGHQQIPAILYITLLSSKQEHIEYTTKRGIEQGVFPFFVTLLPFFNRPSPS